jgi:hypothetical protein
MRCRQPALLHRSCGESRKSDDVASGVDVGHGRLKELIDLQIPMIESVDEAKSMVQAAKFPRPWRWLKRTGNRTGGKRWKSFYVLWD